MDLFIPEDLQEDPEPVMCADGCGTVVTGGNAHHYIMAMSNARVSRIDSRPCCSPECLRSYAMSGGENDPPPAGKIAEPISGAHPYEQEFCCRGGCPRCNGLGYVRFTPWFVHSDAPALSHLIDGPVTCHIIETAPGKAVTVHAKAECVSVSDNDHVKEVWQFDHAAQLNAWSATPVSEKEHDETRAKFAAMRVEAHKKIRAEKQALDAIEITESDIESVK